MFLTGSVVFLFITRAIMGLIFLLTMVNLNQSHLLPRFLKKLSLKYLQLQNRFLCHITHMYEYGVV